MLTQTGLRLSSHLALALRRAALPLLLLSTLAAMSGCAELNQLLQATNGAGGLSNLKAPQVSATPMRLTRAPSLALLGAYYCPTVINDPIARLGCRVALGPQPSPQQLQFEFGTTVTIKNPNNVPIPALDVLLAMKLFQGAGAEALGAVCVSMCGANDPSCNGAPKPGACTSNQKTIRTMNDFVRAVPGLIAGLAMAALTGELRKSNIVAGGNVQVNLNFAMGIDQALRVFEKVIQQTVQSQLQGGRPSLAVPVSAEGTVFVQIPGTGRLGVGFGPLLATWQIL
jgi:hypothetical protein